MLTIDTPDALTRALGLPLDPQLRRLLLLRRHQLQEDGIAIGELGPFLIVQPGDTVGDVEAALGLPITSTDPDFVPLWEWCLPYGSGWEIAFVWSDAGDGAVLFVPDDATIDAALLAIIRRHADDGPSDLIANS